MTETAAAVIVAGGSGARMGTDVPKQYLDLLGAPVLLWSVSAFLSHPGIRQVVVVLPASDAAAPPRWLAELSVSIVPGGATRADSVRAGLDALPPGDGVVLVHDAARPLVSRAVITRVLGVASDAGAIAAIPVVDTVKEVDGSHAIVRTVDRSRLFAAQTPQGFPLRALRAAHERAAAEGTPVTDDAQVFERFGLPVKVVEGSMENIKITRPEDLEAAAALARMRQALDWPVAEYSNLKA